MPAFTLCPRGAYLSVARRKAARASLATRALYSSEDEWDELAAESTDADEEERHMPTSASSAAAAAATAGASSAAKAATPHPAHRLPQARRPHHSLALRLFSRTGPPIKQWPMALAERSRVSNGAESANTKPPNSKVDPAYDSDSSQEERKEPTVKLEHPASSAAAAAANKHSSVSAHFSRPFDIVPPSAGAAGTAAAGAAAAASSSAGAAAPAPSSSNSGATLTLIESAPPRYWTYRASGVVNIKRSPAYTVTDHSGYTDPLVLRASPPLTPRELAALTPVSAEDACRENGLTLLRHQRVKLSGAVRAQVTKAMKSVTGEIDRKVLAMVRWPFLLRAPWFLVRCTVAVNASARV